MSSMKDCIRKYVKEHNNKVTNQEVINYILKKKKIKATKESIRITLWRVLNEIEGTLREKGIREEIKDYIEKHNKSVTFKEVEEHICQTKKMKVTENYIRKVLREVLAEVGGTLERRSIKKEIKDYVKKHDNCVSFQEVKDYIHDQGMDRVDASIKLALREVLNEVGGTLKSPKKQSY